jgi:L-lactate utilization protein LutC
MSPNNDTNKYAQIASDETIETTKKALETNGFKVIVVDNLDAAKTEILGEIPKGSEVLTVSSVTVDQSGISSEINESGNYDSTRDKFSALWSQPEKALEMRRIGSAADFVVGSVHALTEDGQALIASASGSQIPSYVFGANHVIWVVGAQKIVKDLSEGFKRIEEYVLPLEDKRALVVYKSHSSLNKILVYRKETGDRVTIILVKDTVGY